MSVYDFCLMAHKVLEVRLHLWSHDSDGREICEHLVVKDRLDTYKYKKYSVWQFVAVKENVVDIIAADF